MILKILLVIIGVFLGLVVSGFCQSAKARDTITMTLEDYKTDTKTGIVIATMTCDMNPKRRKQEKDLDDYCRKRVCPVCIFKNQEPCITNKIAYGVATNKEVEENYKKMLEEEELKE